MNLYLEEGRKVFVKDDSEHALFTNCSGKAMSRQGFWKMTERLCPGAGIHRDITPHTIETFFCSTYAAEWSRHPKRPGNAGTFRYFYDSGIFKHEY